MAWIFVDKESEGNEQMRSQMRRSMRGGGYRHYGDNSSYREGYRQGYKHGWEDMEDDDMEYRRARDSRGRFV